MTRLRDEVTDLCIDNQIFLLHCQLCNNDSLRYLHQIDFICTDTKYLTSQVNTDPTYRCSIVQLKKTWSTHFSDHH